MVVESDDARRTILARRARFIAAALSGIAFGSNARADTEPPYEGPDGELVKCLSWFAEFGGATCDEPAAAGSAELEAAKPLMLEAKARAAAGDARGAQELLERVLQLTHHPLVAVELARTFESSGQFVEALAIVLRYAGCASSKEAGTEDALQQIKQAILPKLSRVRLDIRGFLHGLEVTVRIYHTGAHPGTAVELEKPLSALGGELCFNPGILMVGATRADSSMNSTVVLTPGSSHVVTLDLGAVPQVCLSPLPPQVCLQPPFPPPPEPYAGPRIGVGFEALGLIPGAEAGAEAGGSGYVGWGADTQARFLLFSHSGGTSDGQLLPLGAGATVRHYYTRPLGAGLSFIGGYLFTLDDEPRELQSGPFAEARLEPVVIRFGRGRSDLGLFTGVRYANLADSDFGFAAVIVGAHFSLVLWPDPEAEMAW